MKNEPETIRSVSLTHQLRTAYLSYAMSVIVSRALPDARDGLKPVQRRILYGMWDMGVRSDQPYKKSARIVGDVLGKMHPHGDSAVYDALSRMAQPWSMRYPLIDGQGNFGSIDGDPPAAMRYTEARLTPIAEVLLSDIEKDTVPFRNNFDGSYREPTVLPSLIPHLLLNGSSGIAVGMATNIPPHNLVELCDAIIRLIDDPETTIDELIEIIPGPDFPTGGLILGREGIRAAYSTGRGQITLRAKTHLEEAGRGASLIVVTELPYQVNKARLHERIAELVRERKIEGIRDVRDESDRNGMRLVIVLKNDAQPNHVLHALYKHTQMQTTFGINMLALTDNGRQPRVLPLKALLQEYIHHRQEVIRRRAVFDLTRARERLHVLDGYMIAINHLDAVIHTIRTARSADDARAVLMRSFALTDRQAQAILDLQLRRLAALERKKIENEHREVIRRIAGLESLLANPRKVLALMKEDLQRLKEQFGDQRRTRIVDNADQDTADGNQLSDTKTIIVITADERMMRYGMPIGRPADRDDRDARPLPVETQPVVRIAVTCRMSDRALACTNRGTVYSFNVRDVPDGHRSRVGASLRDIIPLLPDERIIAILSTAADAEYLVLATVHGRVKRLSAQEAWQLSSSGKRISIITLRNDDELGWVRSSRGHEDVLLTTALGQTLRFPQSDVRAMGPAAGGIIGIDLKSDDRVIHMDLATPGNDLLVITERGIGKRTDVGDYPVNGRATGGVNTILLRDHDRLAGAAILPQQATVLVASSSCQFSLDAAKIPRAERRSRGIAIINLPDRDSVVSVTVIEP